MNIIIPLFYINVYWSVFFLSAETGFGTSNNNYIIASVVIVTSIAILLVVISLVMLIAVLQKCYLNKPVYEKIPKKKSESIWETFTRQ